MAFNIFISARGGGITKNAAKESLSFGDDSLRVALGITKDGKLYNFARSSGFTTYFDYYKGPRGMVFNKNDFVDLMNKADEIHFNTNRFDFGNFGHYLKNFTQRPIPPSRNTTNFELHQLLVNESWRKKTTFH